MQILTHTPKGYVRIEFVKECPTFTGDLHERFMGTLFSQAKLMDCCTTSPVCALKNTIPTQLHVFALMHLLGPAYPRSVRQAPLHPRGRQAVPNALRPDWRRINAKHIRAHWDEILRLAASIRQGTVMASLMLRKLGSYLRRNGLAVALRELGHIECMLFALDWMQSVELRRCVQIGLNIGEAKNALPRAVFLNQLGEIRDRSLENQHYRASGLNLVVTAIILWNTVYLGSSIQVLRDSGKDIYEALLPHLSPLDWEHINLTGDYIWRQNKHVAQGKFRPLREPREA